MYLDVFAMQFLISSPLATRTISIVTSVDRDVTYTLDELSCKSKQFIRSAIETETGLASQKYRCERRKDPHRFHHTDAIQLAESGFFYTPFNEGDDTVTCFLCSKQLGGWEEGDDYSKARDL